MSERHLTPAFIEVAGPRHLSFVRRLGAAAFADRGDFGATLAALFRARGCYTLVQSAGSPLGFCMLRLAEGCAELLALAVRPEARGRGHGLALLAAAEDFGRARGATRARLQVGEGLPARALFEGHGYRLVRGPLARYPSGAPAVTLERALPAAPPSPRLPHQEQP